MDSVTTALLAAITAGMVSAGGDVGKQALSDAYGATRQKLFEK